MKINKKHKHLPRMLDDMITNTFVTEIYFSFFIVTNKYRGCESLAVENKHFSSTERRKEFGLGFPV